MQIYRLFLILQNYFFKSSSPMLNNIPMATMIANIVLSSYKVFTKLYIFSCCAAVRPYPPPLSPPISAASTATTLVT